MADLVINGARHDVKSISLSFPNRPITPKLPATFCTGSFEVSGEITTYFSNEALLKAIIARPHKETVWYAMRPKLYRFAAYFALGMAASFILASGAA